MKIVRDILTLALAASALLGSLILFTDSWLWISGPSHAYGLIGFIIVDISLTVALLENVGSATLGVAFAAIVQLGAMVGDMFFGQPNGVPSTAFRAYLFNDTFYTALLIIKSVVVIVSIVSMMMPLLHRQHQWTGTVPRPRRRT